MGGTGAEEVDEIEEGSGVWGGEGATKGGVRGGGVWMEVWM